MHSSYVRLFSDPPPPWQVDVCHWESFGSEWYTDAVQQLKLKDVRNFGVDAYGKCPKLSDTDPANDIIFTMNGTTSGGVCGRRAGRSERVEGAGVGRKRGPVRQHARCRSGSSTVCLI
jgi:hypothetical protein